MKLRKFLRVLYFPYEALVFLPLVVVLTTVLGIISMILVVTVSPKMGSFLGGRTWARLLAWITPMFVRVKGRENIDATQSYVVVANHASHYDILVLYGWLDVDFKWVMKQELRKIPILGYACDLIGHIYIDRSNVKAAIASLEQAREKIVNGTSVLFFPEGTRSRTGRMRKFKKGAFRMALDLKLPVLPVSIVGTNRILPGKSLSLLPGRAKMIIHPPIPTGGYSEQNLKELMDQTREIIQAGIDGEG